MGWIEAWVEAGPEVDIKGQYFDDALLEDVMSLPLIAYL